MVRHAELLFAHISDEGMKSVGWFILLFVGGSFFSICFGILALVRSTDKSSPLYKRLRIIGLLLTFAMPPIVFVLALLVAMLVDWHWRQTLR